MMASRGMGAISPTKMPVGKKKARRDDTDFTQYAEGGEVKDVTKSFKDAGFYNEAGAEEDAGFYNTNSWSATFDGGIATEVFN